MLAIICSGFAQVLSGVMSNYALQKSPVSVYTALGQLQVVWVAMAGVIFLSEKVTILSIIGIFLIIISSVIVSGSIHIQKEVGLRSLGIIVISSLCTALAVFLDKVLVGTFNQFFYFFVVLTIPIFFLLPDYVRRKKFYNDQAKNHWLIYIVCSIVFALQYYALLSLYTLPDVPLSVAYPIRSTGGIFAVALAIVIFGENKNKKRKLTATVIAVIGAILVKMA
jgi:drug/metabolite transporter (DMT)-like permease